MKNIEGLPQIDLSYDWSKFSEATNPFSDPALTNYSAFQKLILIRVLRQDGLQMSLETFVQEILGPKFVEQGHFDLIKCFEDSTNLSPLLFIMPTEMDNPQARIFQLANAIKFNLERVFVHSMSDSGAQDLIKVIEANLKKPHWIVIENVHGSVSGMIALATFMEQLTGDNVHLDFRLWLSTRELEGFSKSLLQKSVKMMDASKDGLRGLVKRALTSEFPCKTRLIESSPQKDLFQSFIPALCLFHGVLENRHKFDPRGWTFNESDLQLSFHVLYDILNKPPGESQLENGIYLIGKSIYGGQLSNPVDTQTLEELVKEFLDLPTIQSNRIKGLIDGLSRHMNLEVLGLDSKLVKQVNFFQMEMNLAKLLSVQDRKDLL